MTTHEIVSPSSFQRGYSLATIVDNHDLVLVDTNILFLDGAGSKNPLIPDDGYFPRISSLPEDSIALAQKSFSYGFALLNNPSIFVTRGVVFELEKHLGNFSKTLHFYNDHIRRLKKTRHRDIISKESRKVEQLNDYAKSFHDFVQFVKHRVYRPSRRTILDNFFTFYQELHHNEALPEKSLKPSNPIFDLRFVSHALYASLVDSTSVGLLSEDKDISRFLKVGVETLLLQEEEISNHAREKLQSFPITVYSPYRRNTRNLLATFTTSSLE